MVRGIYPRLGCVTVQKLNTDRLIVWNRDCSAADCCHWFKQAARWLSGRPLQSAGTSEMSSARARYGQWNPARSASTADWTIKRKEEKKKTFNFLTTFSVSDYILFPFYYNPNLRLVGS